MASREGANFMSRKKKPRTQKVHKPIQPRQSSKTEAQKLDALVRDTAGVFTCDVETADDCACECERRLEDVDSDLNYRRVAHDIWKERDSRAEALVAAMADLISENERHRQAIAELFQRFELLAKQRDSHEHIGAPEDYFDLVRSRLFGTPAAP
jgi:hypothetical protein